MTAKKTDTTNDAIFDIANEIADERLSQVERWGQQDHPSFISELDRRRAAKSETHWKQRNAARVADGSLTWDGILLEEVYEALAEDEPNLRRAELIQVAAVAAAEVESIDRLLAESASESRSCLVTMDDCEFECEDDCKLEDK